MARNHPLPTSSEMPAQVRNYPPTTSREIPAQARNQPLPTSSEMPAQARNQPLPTSSEMPAQAPNHHPLPAWRGMPFQIGVPIRPAPPGQAFLMAAAMRNRGPPIIKLAAFTHPAAWTQGAGSAHVPGSATGDAATTHPASWPDAAAARQRATLSPAALHDLWAQEAQQVASQLMSMSVRPPPHVVCSPRASTHPASWPDGTGPHPKWRRRAARRLMAMRGDTASTHPAAWEPGPAMAQARPPVEFQSPAWFGTPHPAAWPLEAAKKTEAGRTPEKDAAAATTHHAAWPSEKVEAELPPSVEKRGLPLPAAAPTPRRLSLRRRLIWLEIMVALFVAAMFIFGMPEGSWSARPALAPAVGVSVIDVPPIPPKRISACHDLLPTPAGTYTGRLQRLAAALGDKSRHVELGLNHDNAPVWISEPGPSVEYFIGAFGAGVWSPSERPFLVAVTGTAEDVQVVLLTPAFEASRAHLIPLPDEVAKVATWLTWAESESPYTVLLRHLGNGRGVVLDGAVRTFIADGLRARGASVDRDAARASAVTALRERKDEREIGLMRCANEFTLHAIRRTRAQMSLGIKESETRAILYSEMKALGLSDYGALVLFGENAALPHGRGTDRVLGETDLVLIDAGGRWGGYVADITRTFALPASRISDAHIEVWEIVRAAQRAPANLLSLVDVRDRVLLSWLDDRARETIKKGMAAWGVPPAKGAGPDYTVFTHRLGHGIGLEGHESPYAVQGPLGERELRTGNSFTFEPGVYIPADAKVGDDDVRGLGVRLEDVVVVRERKDGRWMVEWLTGPVQKWGDV